MDKKHTHMETQYIQSQLKEFDTLKYGKAVIGPLPNGQILTS